MSDIRSALEAAFAEHGEKPETPETPAPEVTPEVTPEPEAQTRARDDSGKFTKEPPKEEPKAPEQTKGEDAPAPVPEAPTRKAPSSWKPDAQAAWLKADRGETLTAAENKLIVGEIERRESDFHRGVSEFKTHSERARAYDAIVAPYQETFKQLGVDAPQAISALLQADHKLRNSDPASRVAYFHQLAQSYGVNLGEAHAQQQIDPQTQYLTQQLNQLRQQQELWQNRLQAQEQTRINQELGAFSSNPEFAHYEAVRNDMADLLEAGKATSLKEAYEKAVWMNPDVRQSLIEQQKADAQRKAAEQIQHQRAKTAAVSVKGSSPSSVSATAGKGSSVREALEAAFANIQ